MYNKLFSNILIALLLTFVVGQLFARGQTCELGLYINAENIKGSVQPLTVVAVSKTTSRSYRSVWIKEGPQFTRLPEGSYSLSLRKSGFATLVGDVEVNCGSSPDRKVYVIFSLCASELDETFNEEPQTAISSNVNTIPPKPTTVCRQLREKREIKRQDLLNQTAVWTEVVRNDKGVPYFVDSRTIERKSESVAFRIKSGNDQATTYLIAQAHCGNSTIIFTSRFTGFRGAPTLFAQEADGELIEAKRGTVIHRLITYACER